MTVPQVNVSREDTATMTKNIDAAFNNLSSTGNPIAPAYSASTWGGGGNLQRHHVIPVSVTTAFRPFFEKLREGTLSASGGAFSFDTNDAQNAIYLPNDNSAALIGKNGHPPLLCSCSQWHRYRSQCLQFFLER